MLWPLTSPAEIRCPSLWPAGGAVVWGSQSCSVSELKIQTHTWGGGGGGVSKWTQHFPHSVFSTSSPSPPVSVHLPAWISTSAKKFKKVVGKETYSETLESTPSLEKEKFPQDYFPEVGRVMTDITNVLWWMNTRLVYTQQRCSIAHFKKL